VKYLKITILIIFLWTETRATGIFNLGLMAGAANDAGNVEQVAGDINSEMRSVAGASVMELETAYSPVLSVNLAYISDTLLFKTGWEYSTNSFYNSSGSIRKLGITNAIEVDYTRYTFPLSFGIVLPLTDRNRFYFAGGLNISYVLMKVKQSNPGTISYPGKSHTFSAYVTGTQLKFGAETLIDRNYSFAFEVTRYFGNHKRIESEDGNASALMSVNSFEITAGINYNMDLKI
jgi:hypothetical protein